jgi:hypothetical protein
VGLVNTSTTSLLCPYISSPQILSSSATNTPAVFQRVNPESFDPTVALQSDPRNLFQRIRPPAYDHPFPQDQQIREAHLPAISPSDASLAADSPCFGIHQSPALVLQPATNSDPAMSSDIGPRKAFKVFQQEFLVDERYTVTKELGQGAYGIVW